MKMNVKTDQFTPEDLKNADVIDIPGIPLEFDRVEGNGEFVLFGLNNNLWVSKSDAAALIKAYDVIRDVREFEVTGLYDGANIVDLDYWHHLFGVPAGTKVHVTLRVPE